MEDARLGGALGCKLSSGFCVYALSRQISQWSPCRDAHAVADAPLVLWHGETDGARSLSSGLDHGGAVGLCSRGCIGDAGDSAEGAIGLAFSIVLFVIIGQAHGDIHGHVDVHAAEVEIHAERVHHAAAKTRIEHAAVAVEFGEILLSILDGAYIDGEAIGSLEELLVESRVLVLHSDGDVNRVGDQRLRIPKGERVLNRRELLVAVNGAHESVVIREWRRKRHCSF